MRGASDLNLRLSYWFLSHKDQLKKWWVLSLIAVDVFLLGFVFAAAYVVAKDRSALDQARTLRTGTPLFTSAARGALAQELVRGVPVALLTDATHVDLAVELTNPNETYGVEEVSYRFSYGGKQLPVRTTFLLPNSPRFLAELGVAKAAEGEAPTLEIVSVRWRRPEDLAALRRVKFRVSNLKYDASVLTASQPPKPAPRLRATILNDSAYAYRTVDISIGLIQAGQLVAVNSVRLNDWGAFAEKPIDLQWLAALPAQPDVVIVPQINYFDESNFLRP